MVNSLLQLLLPDSLVQQGSVMACGFYYFYKMGRLHWVKVGGELVASQFLEILRYLRLPHPFLHPQAKQCKIVHRRVGGAQVAQVGGKLQGGLPVG